MELMGVHHVSLTVRDLGAATAFYTEVLGLKLLPRPQLRVDGAWLELADGRQVHLIVDPRHVPADGPHFAVAVPDIEAGVAELVAGGLEVSPVSGVPGGPRQCFFHDPDGNRIELSEQPRAALV